MGVEQAVGSCPRSRRTRIAEIVGPPGAGKTTLLWALAGRLPELQPIDRWRPFLSYSSIARDAVGLLPFFIERWRSRQPLARRDMERMIRLSVTRRIADGWNDEVVVMDQGPIYTLGRLRLSGCGPDEQGLLGAWWTRAAQEWAARLDAVVYLDAEDDVLLQRITDRKKPHRLLGDVDGDGIEWLARLREALERTVHTFRASSSLTLLRFDTGREALPWIVDRVSPEFDGERCAAP